MSIDAISALTPAVQPTSSGVTATSFLIPVAAPSSTSTLEAAQAGNGVLFGETLAGSIDGLQALQSNSDQLAMRAVTGDLDDIHDYTIASSQAGVALELTAALRNKAVDAFTEIMRMQA